MNNKFRWGGYCVGTVIVWAAFQPSLPPAPDWAVVAISLVVALALPEFVAGIIDYIKKEPGQ